MTGVNIEHDDATMARDASVSLGLAVRLLRVVWGALLDGAAMYGAAVHGYSNPDDLQYDVIRPTDNE
jgi:hypothetical protein